MRRWGALLLIAAMVAGGLVTASAQGARRGGTLRVGVDADPPSMDPHRSAAAVDRQVFQNLYDKLADTDETLAIVPMLATAWAISPDGKTVRLKLREDVKFHDGTPFNADAVKYNFNRMMDPKFPSVRRNELGPIQKVTVVSPTTVEFALEKPYSPLMYVLTDRSGMMVSPAEARKTGTNFGLHPVGSGPFRFVEKIPQDHVTLERVPGYWVKDRPYLDRIVYRAFPDDNTRVVNLKSGDVDIINLVPLSQIKELTKAAAQPGARFRVIERGAFAWTALRLNVTKPPFDNKLLRQALSATIDRHAIASVLLQGAAYPAYSFFPNGTPAYDRTWTIPPRNIPLAKEKLAAAGRSGGFEFTVLTVPGQEDQAVLQAVQSMAADAGIQMKIRLMEFGTLLQETAELRHQAVLLGWSGRPDPDFNIYPFVSEAGIGTTNRTGYANPKVQELLDAARILTDLGQRRRAYHEVMKILADDMPNVWLYFPKEYKLVSTRVNGFVHVPDGMMRFASVWLSP